MDRPTEIGRWTQRALDGLSPARVVTIAVVLLGFVGPMHPTADTDTWWHLRTGDLILQQGSLPDTDPFSWTATGRPWVTHEWLSEVIYAAIARLSGPAGLLVLSGVLVGITALALLRALAHVTDDAWAKAVALLVSVAGGSLLWSIRPHLFSLALVAVFLALCLGELRSPARRITWLLVPLTLLWANLHGAFVLGPFLIGLVMIGGAAEKDPAWQRLGLILGVCLVAGSVNPAGPALYLYPLEVASVSGEVLEWRSPSIQDTHGLIFVLTVVATFGAAILRRMTIPPHVLIPALGFVLLGFAALRNIGAALVVLSPCLAYALGGVVHQARRAGSDRKILGATVAALGAGAIALAAVNFIGRSDPYLLGESRFPRAAVAELREQPPGRLANPYNWGGYLIYRAPEFPVSMDGRNDMYGARLLERQMLLEELRPGWNEFLSDNDVRYVLWQRAAPLAEALRLVDGWSLLYEDRRAVLFERSG